MRRIYISTVNRVGDDDVTSIFGHLYVLDWNTGKLLQDLKQKVANDISIGRSKGARGIVFADNKIYVANDVNAITVYDADTYKILDHKAFEELSVVHQMKMHNDLLCVASTSNDRVVRIDKDLNVVSVESVENKKILPTEGEWVNDKLHFNSICWLPNGDEIHVYNGLHMVYNFTKKEVVYQGDPLQSPHDVIVFGDSLVVNSSASHETIQIKNSKARVIFSVPSEEIQNVGHNQWGYARGLTSYGNKLFISYTPTKILELKHQDGIFHLEKKITIDEGHDKSVYDLCLDPRDWHGN